MYVYCTLCVPGTLSGQQRSPDLLGLELQIAVNHSVGTGKQTRVLRSFWTVIFFFFLPLLKKTLPT